MYTVITTFSALPDFQHAARAALTNDTPVTLVLKNDALPPALNKTQLINALARPWNQSVQTSNISLFNGFVHTDIKAQGICRKTLPLENPDLTPKLNALANRFWLLGNPATQTSFLLGTDILGRSETIKNLNLHHRTSLMLHTCLERDNRDTNHFGSPIQIDHTTKVEFGDLVFSHKADDIKMPDVEYPGRVVTLYAASAEPNP